MINRKVKLLIIGVALFLGSLSLTLICSNANEEKGELKVALKNDMQVISLKTLMDKMGGNSDINGKTGTFKLPNGKEFKIEESVPLVISDGAYIPYKTITVNDVVFPDFYFPKNESDDFVVPIDFLVDTFGLELQDDSLVFTVKSKDVIVAEKPKEETSSESGSSSSTQGNSSSSTQSGSQSGSQSGTSSGSSSSSSGTSGGSSQTTKPTPTPSPAPTPTPQPAPTPAPTPEPTPAPTPAPTPSTSWSTVKSALLNRGWTEYNSVEVDWKNNGSVWTIGDNAFGLYLGGYSDAFATEVQYFLSLVFPTQAQTVWGYIQNYSSGYMVKYADGYTIEFNTLNNGAVEIGIHQ